MKKILALALFALMGTAAVSAHVKNASQAGEYAAKSKIGKVAHAATSKKAIACYAAAGLFAGYALVTAYIAGQNYDNTLFPVRMLKALFYGGRGGYVNYNS